MIGQIIAHHKITARPGSGRLTLSATLGRLF
jgi:hypothetical protein